ncbi:MAG: hypothetical protein ACRDO1_03000 [Nocardioidaceae bacterium]
MTDGAPHPKNNPAADAPPGLPRWVKLLAVGALIAGIVLVVAMLLVGGEHGAGMHGR